MYIIYSCCGLQQKSSSKNQFLSVINTICPIETDTYAFDSHHIIMDFFVHFGQCQKQGNWLADRSMKCLLGTTKLTVSILSCKCIAFVPTKCENMTSIFKSTHTSVANILTYLEQSKRCIYL